MSKFITRDFLRAKKDASGKGLYVKNFSLPFFSLTTYYQNFTNEIALIFENIYEKLEINKQINALLMGDKVNFTENKPALHHYYRNPLIQNEDYDLIKKISALKSLVDAKKYKNIFMFGIGGSYEGPKLLQEFTQKNKVIFITGPDQDEFNYLVKPRLKEKNLYIFVSKSFTTEETLLSLSWLPKSKSRDNFLAITANRTGALKLGFPSLNIIEFPDSIGGRYSIWSAVSAAVLDKNEAVDFLEGAKTVDQEIISKSTLLKALKTIVYYDIWCNNFLNKSNRVLLTYNWRLRSFSRYIQQLEMESLGKPMGAGSLFKKTGQTVYGGFGSVAQHSYFQLLHQGTSNSASDIVHSRSDFSNLLNAQAEGQGKLLSGKFKFSKGAYATNSNIPVNFFLLESLSIKSLGALIAFWEYRVFLTAALLEINPFDQFGVYAGKKIASRILKR